MKYKILTVLACVIMSGGVLQAQKVWTLSDCIEHAHANNLQIKQQQLNAQISEGDLFTSKMRVLPNLNGSLGRNYNFGRQVDPITNDFNAENTVSDYYRVDASVDLFRGLQSLNTIRASENYMLARIQDVEKEKVNISLQIATAYLRILFSQEILEVARSQREVTALQVERTDKLVQAGNAARGELLEIIAQQAAEDLNVTTSLNDLNLAYLNLTQILDLDSVGNFDIYSPDSIQPDFSVAITSVHDVYLEALGYLPHVKSAEYDLQASKNYLSVQKGMRSPTLSMSGAWRTGYSDNFTLIGETDVIPYMDQLDVNNNKSFGVSLTVPIFNRWYVQNSISTAQIQVLNSENTLDLTKQQLYKEIQQAYNDAVSAKEKYSSALEAVNSYREAFGYTEHKFTVGIVNSVEYNIAKNNYIKAESDLLQAKYEYVFSLKILDFYRGIPLSLS